MTQGIFNNMCFSMFCIKAFSIKGDEFNGRKSNRNEKNSYAEVTAEDIGRRLWSWAGFKKKDLGKLIFVDQR